MMPAKKVIIAPRTDGWVVEKPENSKASFKFDTKQEAIEKGREVAKGDKAELIILNKDGKIGGKDSEGNDPIKIKG